MKINLDGFNRAIENRNLMDSWGDGLFVDNDEERKLRSEKMYNEAKEKFISIMSSPKNDQSASYETWAVNKVLGLFSKAALNIKISRNIRR